MPFCKNCGTEMGPDQRYCPKCGAPADGNTTQGTYYNAGSGGKDHTAEFAPDDIQANHGISVLGYFGILMLIPILVRPDSRFVKFHCNQGLVIFLLELALEVVRRINHLLYIPVFRGLISFACWAMSIALFVFSIMGIVNAAKGRAKEIPVIGSISIIKY